MGGRGFTSVPCVECLEAAIASCPDLFLACGRPRLSLPLFFFVPLLYRFALQVCATLGQSPTSPLRGPTAAHRLLRSPAAHRCSLYSFIRNFGKTWQANLPHAVAVQEGATSAKQGK